jgi:hypothetical protein
MLLIYLFHISSRRNKRIKKNLEIKEKKKDLIDKEINKIIKNIIIKRKKE